MASAQPPLPANPQPSPSPIDGGEPERGRILDNLFLFGRILRMLGLNVHTGRMLDAVQVLDEIGFSRKTDVRAALRTLLVHRRDDLPVFDEAFDVFWRQRKESTSTMDLRSMGERRRYRSVEAGPPLPSDAGVDSGSADEAPDDDQIVLTRTFSAREVLRTRDFAEFTPGEEAQARQLMAGLQWRPGFRRARRMRPGGGDALDLRRTLRANARLGGEPVRLLRLRRKQKPRRLVVICDVSGSMERYTRMLLHFVHSLYGGLGSHVEAFLFATRLTRVTRQLGQRDIDRAVAEVARAVPDWSGGTRIGQALKEFNFRWARRTLGWGAIVLIVSDGWDRGDPELLGREMGRLQRSCNRLIWLNPLAGAREYEPLTQGMRAAYPYIDDLLPSNSLAALIDLAALLNTLPSRVAARRRQAPYISAQSGGADSAAAASREADGGREADSWRSPPKDAPPPRSRHADANPTFRHPLWGRGGGDRS